MSRPHGRLSDKKFSQYIRTLNYAADGQRKLGRRNEAKRITRIRDLVLSKRSR